VHRTTSCMNFATCDSFIDFWLSSSITMVHNKLEQAPSMF
jgi:hypothetical protein